MSLPAAYALDQTSVLASNHIARGVLDNEVLAQMAFLMALWVALVANAKARATGGTHLGRRAGRREAHRLSMLPPPGRPGSLDIVQ